jgi:hypothetical protein
MSNQYLGTWRIIEMEQWDQDFIDPVVPGYITFRADHVGAFQLGAVHGDLDYRLELHHDTERLAFSWEGGDAMDPVSGADHYPQLPRAAGAAQGAGSG